MTQLTEESIRNICKELNETKYEKLLQLFLSLSEEEAQVIHQSRPHRIIKKISAQINDFLEEDDGNI